MIEDGEVRSEGMYMRTMFGYKMLGEIGAKFIFRGEYSMKGQDINTV